MSCMGFVTVLCCRLLRYVMTGGVNVFHVCLNFGVVYGVGVRVNVCGVACVVCCDACRWKCSFMGSVCVSSCR